MKLAYSSNAYMRWPIEQAIERIAELGYEGVELMADIPHAWPATTTEARLAEIRRKIAECNVTISNINAFMTRAIQDFWHPSWIEPDPDFRAMRIEHTKNALRMAAKLGAACITTEPGGPLPARMSRDDAMDLFVAGLNEALRVAEEVGVLLLVEPEPELLIENASQFEALAARIDSPAFALNFDIGHFFCVGEPLVDTVRRLRPWTRHYHIEDIPSSRVHQHLVPGRGAIDFVKVLAAIHETNYAGWITVELYPYLDDPDAAGREAREYLHQAMPR
jgi:sugar phosphate isomerase/epimerase